MFFKIGKSKKRADVVQTISDEDDSIVRTERCFCYFVYSDKDDTIIDSIFLTKTQAQQLNDLLLKASEKDQSLTLLRLIRR